MTFDPSAEPDFTNDEGVKWWHQKTTTHYAARKGLKRCNVWITELKNGVREYVLTEGGSVIAASQTLEGIAVKIDTLAFVRKNP